MCGIYGYIGKPTNGPKAIELFRHLAIETEIRGTHATGYYALNGIIHYGKAPVKASEYFKPDFVDCFEGSIPTVIIGHDRYATHGVPEDNRNNHPFVSKRFGFIHNGVVGGVATPEELGIRPSTECDSEWIFRFFLKNFWGANDENVKKAIATTLKRFDEGGVASAMVDSKTRKLYLFRNTGRSIVFAKIKSLNIIVFASTEAIMSKALKLARINEKVKIEDLAKGEVMEIDEELVVDYLDVPDLRESKIELPSTNYAAYNFKPWDNYEFNKWKSKYGTQASSYTPGSVSDGDFTEVDRELGIKPKKIVKVSGGYCQCLVPLRNKKNNGFHDCGRNFISEVFLRKHLEDDHGLFGKYHQDKMMKLPLSKVKSEVVYSTGAKVRNEISWSKYLEASQKEQQEAKQLELKLLPAPKVDQFNQHHKL
jgi:predicted glutamine amidotransferase